jgi:hypothetical protein
VPLKLVFPRFVVFLFSKYRFTDALWDEFHHKFLYTQRRDEEDTSRSCLIYSSAQSGKFSFDIRLIVWVLAVAICCKISWTIRGISWTTIQIRSFDHFSNASNTFCLPMRSITELIMRLRNLLNNLSGSVRRYRLLRKDYSFARSMTAHPRHHWLFRDFWEHLQRYKNVLKVTLQPDVIYKRAIMHDVTVVGNHSNQFEEYCFEKLIIDGVEKVNDFEDSYFYIRELLSNYICDNENRKNVDEQNFMIFEW